MQSSNTIRWYVDPGMDAAELNSPQPCPRGIHCDYRRFNKESGEMEPACCKGVHPGEEGTGRRIFPARQIKETGPEASFIEQPACVRLTGAKHQFYERRRLKLSWMDWCEREGIPYTPAEPGQDFEHVVIDSIVKRAPASPKPTQRGPAPPRLSRKALSGGAITLEELERELFGDRHFPLCRILATQPTNASGISETEFPPLPNLCALAMKSM